MAYNINSTTVVDDTSAWYKQFVDIPQGTASTFIQAAAPTGWTKSTTHNDKALRIVNGTASSGGTSAFSTVFSNKSISGTINSTTAVNDNSSETGTVSLTGAAIGSTSPSGSVTVSGGSVTSATPGGTVSYSLSVGSTTLTSSTMPSHSHPSGWYPSSSEASGYGLHTTADDPATGFIDRVAVTYATGQATGNSGSGGSHTHSVGSNPTGSFSHSSSHTHSFSAPSYTASGNSHTHTYTAPTASFTGDAHTHTQAAHTHTFSSSGLDMRIKYIDSIIATKD